MQTMIKQLIGKRPVNILIDGKLLDGGKDADVNLQIEDTWNPHIITDEEDVAKKYFSNEKCKVLQGNRNTIAVSLHWSAIAVMNPYNESDFAYYVNRVSQTDGLIIYRYDNLFEVGDEEKMERHFNRCREILGVRHLAHYQEDGIRYIVAKRTHINLLNLVKYEDFAQIFCGPIVDASLDKVKFINAKVRWTHPSSFEELVVPHWKTEAFFELQTTTDAFFEDSVKPKFIGGTIEVPNHEQLTVLLASGSINNEITLEDGRIVVMKGTERISTKDRIKYDIENKPSMKVEQQVRETLIYALDMTNGEFFKLASGV